MWTIKVDLEFAALCGAQITPKAMAKVDEALTTAMPPTGLRVAIPVPWPAGLTLTNAPKGEGVLVVRVIRGNGAHQSGIRVGDLILTVNGTKVRDHTTAVDFIEQRCRVGDCLVGVRKFDALLRQPRELFRRLSSGVAQRVVVNPRSSPLRHSQQVNGEYSDEVASDDDEIDAMAGDAISTGE